MTKKHFNRIAEELHAIKPSDNQDKLRQWKLGVYVMADVCEGYNANFNRRRFYKACGLEE